MDSPEIKRKKLKGDANGDGYFRSYSDIGIHEDMIADTVRTNTYRLAILRNYEKFRGKVVIDVGCGTGILSMFCVQAGAKKVYGIEASDMALEARKAVAANKMSERIEIIHGMVEDVEIPEKADVIVSEWMGYFLIYETMLPSVLHARDHWLKKGGYMFPGTATLFLAPFCDAEGYNSRREFWEKEVLNAYKVDLSSMVPLSDSCVNNHIHVRTVEPEDILAHAETICDLDLLRVTPQDLKSIKSNFMFKCFGHGEIHGLAAWFKVTFPMEVTLNTSPYGPETHWMQTLVYFDKPLKVEQDTELKGAINLSQHEKNRRFLDVTIEYSVNGSESLKKELLMDEFVT